MNCKHTRNILLILLVATGWLQPCKALAQHDAPTGLRHRTTMLAVGAADILDTYLSAETYQGTELRYLSESSRPLILHRGEASPWRQAILNEGALNISSNRADNNDELGGHYGFQYRLRRTWWPHRQWLLQVGTGIGASLGFLYNTRNSNNPAQLYADLNLIPSAAATYNFHLFRRPSSLCYEASVPLAGLMFSPNYGQSYYEIFSRGNYDHNIVPTTIGATPSLRHMLTLDIALSRRHPQSTLRIGYLGDYRQARVNNLKRHHYAHLLVLGWTVTR